MVNVRDIVLKLNLESFARTMVIYYSNYQKILWSEKNVKNTIIKITKNLNNIYLPSLKLSKAEQIKKLFEKINITIPETGFIFSIDEFKLLKSKNTVISNISVDYSIILNNSLSDLKDNPTVDAIMLLIDRIVDELSKSKRKDKDKYIIFFNNMKTSKATGFEEALQRILFFNQILWQTGHGLNGFGRLDYILDNIYKNDSISKEKSLSIIKEFLKAANSYFYFKSGALAGDTGQIIVLGGDGFCSDLTYLFIGAVRDLHLPDPKLILRYEDNIPRDLVELAVDCMSTGVGSPLMSNDEMVIDNLVDFGYDREDARNYVVSACWEPAPVGNSFEMNNIATLVFINPLNTLLESENLNSIKDFDTLFKKYQIYLKKYIDNLLDDLNTMNWEEDPLISLFFECDKDLSEGGAKYNNYGLTSVSLSNTVNSLLNIKKFVFEDEKYTFEELNKLRLDNFEDENIIKMLKNNDLKFGMDNNEVIDLTNDITSFASDVFKTHKTKFGGKFKFGLSAPSYVSAAGNTPASFDGRRNGEEFHTHISYDDNSDYTELMRFASKLDYSDSRFNGNVVDFMVTPSFIKNNFEKFTDFIMLSLKMGVFQMQLNVVSSETLIKAKADPDAYPNLIVRVWGFSAYFKDLPSDYQDVLIKRALENENH